MNACSGLGSCPFPSATAPLGVIKDFHIKGTNLAGAEVSLVIAAESEHDARRTGENIGLDRITVTPVHKPQGPDDPPAVGA